MADLNDTIKGDDLISQTLSEFLAKHRLVQYEKALSDLGYDRFEIILGLYDYSVSTNENRQSFRNSLMPSLKQGQVDRLFMAVCRESDITTNTLNESRLKSSLNQSIMNPLTANDNSHIINNLEDANVGGSGISAARNFDFSDTLSSTPVKESPATTSICYISPITNDSSAESPSTCNAVRRIFDTMNRSREAEIELEKSIWATAAKVFGIASLKPFQIEAIKATLKGNDTFISYPTGSGKSLCMLLPSVVTSKTTLVIVPTLSLLISHCNYLTGRNIEVAGFGGINDYFVNRSNEDKLRSGIIRIAVMTPEYLLANPDRLELIVKLHQEDLLQMIAIDEVHCAIEWKYFRPSYQGLEAIKRVIDVPFMLLTATARPMSVTMLSSMYLSGSRSITRLTSDVDRANLRLSVEFIDMDLSSKDTETWSLGLVDKILAIVTTEKTIIYIDNTSSVDLLTQLLLERNVTVMCVKGGEAQTRTDRCESILSWERGLVQFVVATCSFGLGVSRPDIRYVIRIDYPATLEELVQEFGRSGRDGNISHGILMVPNHSGIIRFYLKDRPKVHQDEISKSFLDIWSFVHTDTCRRGFIQQAFGATSNQNCILLGGELCDNCSRTASHVDRTEHLVCALKCALEMSSNNGHNYGLGKTAAYIAGSNEKSLELLNKGDYFGTGSRYGMSREWWISLLRLSVARGFLSMHWYVVQTGVRTLFTVVELTERGKSFINDSQSLFMCSIVVEKNQTALQTVGSKPWKSVVKLLKNQALWYTIESDAQIKFPGYVKYTDIGKIGYCSDFCSLPMFIHGGNTSSIWNEIQLSKSHFHARHVATDIHCNGTLVCTEVSYRISNCMGVKVCSEPDCMFVASSQKKKNNCKSHPSAVLISSLNKFGRCPVSFVFVSPKCATDNRRWLGVLAGQSACDSGESSNGYLNLHSHPLPIYESSNLSGVRCRDLTVPKCIRAEMSQASVQNMSLTPSQLLLGIGQSINPRLASDAVTYGIAERITHASRQKVLGINSTYEFLQSFDNKRLEEIDQQLSRLGDVEKSQLVKYLAESYVHSLPTKNEFDINPSFLTMNVLQVSLFCDATFLSFDVTFNESREFPIMLQVGTFSMLHNCYIVVAKFRAIRDNYEMYRNALSSIIKVSTMKSKELEIPTFSWSNLEAIIVDWSNVQMRAISNSILTEALSEEAGQKTAEDLLNGCFVHFDRCVQKAAKKFVCKPAPRILGPDLTESEAKNQKENQEKLFIKIARTATSCDSVDDAQLAFKVLSCEADLEDLRHRSGFEFIQQTDRLLVAGNAKNWTKWWSAPSRLAALNPNLRSNNPANIICAPTDTNHLESLNRISKSGQSCPGIKRALLDSYKKDLDFIIKASNSLLSPDTIFHEHSHEQRLLEKFNQRMRRKRKQVSTTGNDYDLMNDICDSPSTSSKRSNNTMNSTNCSIEF